MGVKLWRELAAQGMFIGMDAAEVLAKKIDALTAANLDLTERVLYAERERDEALMGMMEAHGEIQRLKEALERIASSTMSMFLNKDHMLTNMLTTAQKALDHREAK